jgi:predicted secreted protein
MRIDLERADADRRVILGQGDSLVVRLPEQGTTGYVWMVDALPEGTQVAIDDVELESPLRPGASGIRRLELRIGAHPGDVVLTKRQPWNPESEIDSFEVSVQVRGGQS